MRTATSFLALAFLSMAPCARAQMAVEYYHLDAVGTVLAVTNEAGALVEEHDYDVFGQEVSVQAGTQPKRFARKERDGETGWDYFGARYYGSKPGRFTTVDPVYTWKENLADPQRWNRYAYARNNPLRYVDPDGKLPIPASAAMLTTANNPFVPDKKKIDFTVGGLEGVLMGLIPGFEAQANSPEQAQGQFIGQAVTVVGLFGVIGRTGGGGVDTTRVGRWMSAAEHDAMTASGKMVESTLNGVSSVSSPPNPGAWSKQAAGTRYVEFDVPTSAVRGTGANSKIYGPNSIFGPKLGIKEMPPATNIKVTASK